MTHAQKNLPLPKSQSWEMFNQISPTYDCLNHLLSFGLDIHWRQLLVKSLPDRPGLILLDLATGTGDVLLTLVKKSPHIKHAYGLDLADKMLAIAQKKISDRELDGRVELRHADMNEIPFEAESFDVLTLAFGIRNVTNPQTVLNEIYRVCRKGGRMILLEFSLPTNRVWRAVHLFYLRTIVPFIGALVSRNHSAYRYLNQTIEDFPYGEEFCGMMHKAGLSNTLALPLFGGIASIYVGEKQSR